jgi:hypothetical protein
VTEVGDFTFLIDKELASETGEVKIDMTYYGFTVDSANPVGGGGGCSPGACSSGSCGC